MHYKSICDAILSRIRAAINSESFLNQFKEPNHFTRKRLISMYQVIVYLVFPDGKFWTILDISLYQHHPVRFAETL